MQTEKSWWEFPFLLGGLVGLMILGGIVIEQESSHNQRLIDELSRDVLALRQNYQMLRDDFDNHELASAPLPQAKVDAALSKAMHELWNEPFDPPPGSVGKMLRALEASEQDN